MQPLADARGEICHMGHHVEEEAAAHGKPAMPFIEPYLSHHIALTSSPQIHHLGYYAEEEDAARAYDSAARRLRGPTNNKVNFTTADQAATAAAAAAGIARRAAGAEEPVLDQVRPRLW